MYCPKCAAQNGDGARFCRACGSDISLVPQALAGSVPEVRAEAEEDESGRGRKRKHKEKKEKEATVEGGVQTIFGGLGFLLVSVAVYFFGPAGPVWFYWLFLPAFAQIGAGVSQIMRARREQSRALPTPTRPLAFDAAVPPAWRAGELPPRDDSTSYVPPSITEGTTRHLSHAEELRPSREPETRAR